ncbi:MAG: hypothetical protein IKD55_11070 [Sediminibacterium sp.]|nr:hypothetical protein [Sediminibacterium sp.]
MEKINELGTPLSKDQAKKIVGGVTCVNVNCTYVVLPPGVCTVGSSEARCCWEDC